MRTAILECRPRGRPEWRLRGGLAGEWDGFGAPMPDFIDGGDKVIVTGRYVGTYRATGKAMNPQALHPWTLKDGRLVAFQQYVDTPLWRATGKA